MGQTPLPESKADAPFAPESGNAFKALRLNVEAHAHHLADIDWTEDQKREFVEALWQIMVGIVDLQYPLLGLAKAQGVVKTLDEDSPSVVASETNSDIEETQDGKAQARTREGWIHEI